MQLFDTWAGVLPPEEFARWCIEPAARIVNELRRKVPNARVIGFPRGAGHLLGDYVDRVPVNAVSVDWMADRKFVRERVQSRVAVQGNLDPLALLAGGDALDRAIDAILNDFRRRPVHLQSRARHSAADADRACRADAETRAGQLGLDGRWYPWVKAFHVIAVISWMAGMLYLPRLFVYHCEAEVGSKQSETFKVMERRLLKVIINPAMILTWVLGLMAGLAWQLAHGRLDAGQIRAGDRPVGPARLAGALLAGFRRRPEHREARNSIVLSMRYRRY